MGSSRHDDDDGSDIFWPGYVDATTNLILNLLFLLTILIVAVFMFALELGRTSPKQANNQNKQEAEVVSRTPDPMAENIALKREVERLRLMLEQKGPQEVQSGLAKSVDATVANPRPQNGLDRAIIGDFDIVVRFKEEAIDFTTEERRELRETLKPVAAAQAARVIVDVPLGFSETKRLGFYRAMAVRNVLIEMDVPKDSIDVMVIEGERDANAALVKVKSN